MASFASGLPSNPAVMIPAGGADVAQYFGFALNLAQQLAYLFDEDELFDGAGEMSEAAQMRIIAYLGVMFGAAGATALVVSTSRVAGTNLVKKVGAVIDVKITKKTVEKSITKAVSVVGGGVSGGLTYVTFRPMGHRLADTLVKNLNGDFEDALELNAQFSAMSESVVIEVERDNDEPSA